MSSLVKQLTTINGILFEIFRANYFLGIYTISFKTRSGRTITLYNPIIDILIQLSGKNINFTINTNLLISFAFRVDFRTNKFIHILY